MAKIDINGWAIDKARRDNRISQGLCPMCGKVKRIQDIFCCDICMNNSLNAISSNIDDVLTINQKIK